MKYICPIPWTNVGTTSDGRLKMCCKLPFDSGVALNNKGQAYRLNRPGDIDLYMNSSLMRQVRLDMANGGRPAICEVCYREEDVTGASLRTQYNAAPDSTDYTIDENGRIPGKATRLDLRFGNLCNLKCRMCAPRFSSQIVDEYNTIFPERPLTEKQKSAFNNADWFQDKDGWEAFLASLDITAITEVRFAGGEPTLADGMYTFLEHCITNGVSKNITLYYSINATNLPVRLIELWKEFQSVYINVSLDAVGDLARYIRHPSNWKAISKNVARLDEACGGKIRANIATAVQAYNVMRITDLLNYSLTLKNIEFPDLVQVTVPDYFSSCILPEADKLVAAARLNAWLDVNGERITPENQQNVRRIVDLMMHQDMSALIPKFKLYTERYDKARGESMALVLPELAHLLV